MNVEGAPAISEATRQRIEEALDNWNDLDSPAGQRLEAAQEKLDHAM